MKNINKEDIIDNGNISDGYHTFNELYEHRHALFICLANLYFSKSWKSKLHSDGTSMDGWFISGIELPSGKQISYHLPENLFNKLMIPELEKAPEWDGHTPNDVVDRLMDWLGEPITPTLPNNIRTLWSRYYLDKIIDNEGACDTSLCSTICPLFYKTYEFEKECYELDNFDRFERAKERFCK